MNGNGIFITGTGTDVGKTVITAGILRTLRVNGIDAVPMKPVQSGAPPYPNGLHPTDLHFSLDAAGLHPSDRELALMAPYIYEPACSPHLAGRLAGRLPDFSHIQACVSNLQMRHQTVLVEGAGGVMVPVNESKTILDLMVLLGFPVVLVARNNLGTINHTLLSIQAIRLAGLDILGIVFNNSVPPDPATAYIRRENPDAIAKFGGVPILGQLRHLPGLNPTDPTVWNHFNADLPGLQARLRLQQPDTPGNQ